MPTPTNTQPRNNNDNGKPNFFIKGLLHMSGASVSTLKSCKKDEIIKYARLGLLICIIGLFSGTAFGYMMHSFLQNMSFSILCGIVWAMIIITIDQDSVAAITSRRADAIIERGGQPLKFPSLQWVKEGFLHFKIISLRVLLTLAGSALVSASIMVLLFDSQIEAIIFEQNQTKVNNLEQKNNEDIAGISNKIDKSEERKNQYNTRPPFLEQLDEQIKILTKEIQGHESLKTQATNNRDSYVRSQFGLPSYFSFQDSIRKIQSPIQKAQINQYTNEIVRQVNQISSKSQQQSKLQQEYNQKADAFSRRRDSIMANEDAKILLLQEKEINAQLAADSTKKEAELIYGVNNFIEKLGVYYNFILKDNTNTLIASFFAILIIVIELIVILLKYNSGIGCYEKKLAEERYKQSEIRKVQKDAANQTGIQERNKLRDEFRHEVVKNYYDIPKIKSSNVNTAAENIIRELDNRSEVEYLTADIEMTVDMQQTKNIITGIIDELKSADELFGEGDETLQQQVNQNARAKSAINYLKDGFYAKIEKRAKVFSDVHNERLSNQQRNQPIHNGTTN